MKPNEKYFDHIAGDFAQRYNTKAFLKRREQVWLNSIKRFATERGTCLDAGCGPGVMSRIALDCGMSITCLDSSSEMLDIARRNCEGANFIKGSLPLRDSNLRSRFDLIICSSVIEYVDDPHETMRDMCAMLKDQGVLLVSLPNKLSLYRKVEKLVSSVKPSIRAYLKMQKHQFTFEQARQAISEAGLMYISHEYFCLPSPLYRLRVPESSHFTGSLMLIAARK
jgi:2-polyprenyl-3-methyl-5-hydroxy-6-metoxy-1,4-benzoquinol methylase